MKVPKIFPNNFHGFTLLEIVVVVIIVGVLAGLAMTRFTKTVEFSRSSEALSTISTLRRTLERCYLMSNSYSNCSDFANLDIDDPASTAGSHFTYTITTDVSTFLITATRNTYSSGDGSSAISINQDGEKTATGVFSQIR